MGLAKLSSIWMLLCPSPAKIIFILVIRAVFVISFPYTVDSRKVFILASVRAILLWIYRKLSIRKPPVPQNGSYIFSPICGLTKRTIVFTI